MRIWLRCIYSLEVKFVREGQRRQPARNRLQEALVVVEGHEARPVEVCEVCKLGQGY